jgi:hypothetical protein
MQYDWVVVELERSLEAGKIATHVMLSVHKLALYTRHVMLLSHDILQDPRWQQNTY